MTQVDAFRHPSAVVLTPMGASAEEVAVAAMSAIEVAKMRGEEGLEDDNLDALVAAAIVAVDSAAAGGSTAMAVTAAKVAAAGMEVDASTPGEARDKARESLPSIPGWSQTWRRNLPAPLHGPFYQPWPLLHTHSSGACGVPSPAARGGVMDHSPWTTLLPSCADRELEKWLSGLNFNTIVSDAILRRLREKVPPGQSTQKYEQAFVCKLGERGSVQTVLGLLKETPVRSGRPSSAPLLAGNRGREDPYPS